ncbi:hypothetical protein AB5N19_14109 [Seiridium cardinale]|uniref:Glycan binding protein Y3-like domain-containing protein n=1 Tax=Seiridium cardinale TaxID=138064 RepID=A0ABR2XAD3_9PEZI
MQFSNIVLAALISYASAGCNSGGNEWGSEAAALAKQACDNLLSGDYGPSNTYNGLKSTCFNHNNEKYEFQIWHIKDGYRNLSPAECLDGLTKETNCKHGGKTSYSNWKYRADPNAGAC